MLSMISYFVRSIVYDTIFFLGRVKKKKNGTGYLYLFSFYPPRSTTKPDPAISAAFFLQSGVSALF